MFLWISLLLLILAISFVLARLSMQDYTEIPSSRNFGLFLIRQIDKFNESLLDLIYNELQKTNSIISFERLFKGKEAALAVYGPKKLLSKFTDSLNLLELEDYTKLSEGTVGAWEIGVKQSTINNNELTIGKSIPQLNDDEQLWWQLVLSKSFKSQIRVVVASNDPGKKQDLAKTLILPANVTKLPKVYSTTQLLDFYQKRSFQINEENPVLSRQQILRLLWM